jgi:N-acetylmuramoyl-L-alanine amidase
VRLSRFFFILILIFATIAADAAVKSTAAASKSAAVKTSDSVTIEGVRTGRNANKTRIVIDFNRPADFRVFTMANPWRLVVDVPPAKWKVANTKSMNDSLLKKYRSGDLDDGLMRIIFDMKKAAVIDSVFTLPKDGYNRDRLVIDLQPSSQNLFEANVKKIFGNADIRSSVKTTKKTSSQMAQSNNDYVRNVTALPSRKPSRLSDDTSVADEQDNRPAPSSRKKGGKYVIVLDAGHGGDDPGAISGHGYREKDITLALAREVRRQMQETGRYRVVLTRDADKYIKLYQRVDISREKNADLFISLHADKFERTEVRGASIYTLSSKSSDAETERLAEQENNAGVVAGVDLSSESHDVAGILLDLAMREKMNESNLLAKFIVNAFSRESIRLLPNSHRSAGFAVLKAPDVPAVLIEAGFLSNAEEAKLLKSAHFQSKIASAIVMGVDAYFRKIEALQKQ